MKNRLQKRKATHQKGNLTVFPADGTVIPLNIGYSVTRHDIPSSDRGNIPLPDEENVIQSKAFLDQNHLS